MNPTDSAHLGPEFLVAALGILAAAVIAAGFNQDAPWDGPFILRVCGSLVAITAIWHFGTRALSRNRPRPLTWAEVVTSNVVTLLLLYAVARTVGDPTGFIDASTKSSVVVG